MADHPRFGPLDAETLAAFLDGRLTPAQRARVEAELAASPESYEWLVSTLRVAAQVEAEAEGSPGPEESGNADDPPEAARGPEPRVLPFYRKRGFLTGAAAALAAAAALVLAVGPPSGSWLGLGIAGRSRLEPLVAAVGQERYLEGRLTGGFQYGPLRSATRGTEGTTPNLSLLAAAGALQQESQARPTVDNLHAWGVAQVLLGYYDDGVRALHLALADAPDAPLVMADLAAALIARGDAQSTAYDYPRALTAAEQALAHEPALKEAAFNRALALDRLGLRREARKAWQQVIAMTTGQGEDDAWVAEAGRRAQALALDEGPTLEGFPSLASTTVPSMRVLADEDPQRAREFVEMHVLAEWGRARIEQRHADAEGYLALARVAAESLGTRGNRSLPEEVALIDGATAEATRATLARAHVRFGESLRLYESEQAATALGGFTESRLLFEQAGSPYRLWAAVHEMAVRYLRGELAVATAAAGRLRASPDLERYPEINARLSWAQGLFAANGGRLQEALAHDERAARLYSALGERENGVFLKTLTAEALDFVGDAAQAWRYRVEALRDALPARNPRRPHTTWVNAAIAAIRQGLPAVAVHLQDEAVALAEVHRQPTLTFEAHLYRARARAAAGDTALALEDLRIAEDLLPSLPGAVQTRMKTEVLVTHGMLPGQTADTLSRTAAAWLAEAGAVVRVPQLMQSAAAARLARGDTAGALQDLTQAIDAAAGQVPRAVETLRWAYADTVWPLFRQAAVLRVATGDITGALDTAEMGTMRLAGRGTDPAALVRVPAGVVAVRFLVSDSRTFAVVLTGNGQRAVELGVNMAALERDARRFQLLSAAHMDRTSTDTLLADLGRRWVLPWIDLVPEGATLAVVPDGPMHHVPFAALRLADGRYLAERNPIEVWSDLTARPESTSADPSADMIAVGLERFDHTGFPSLKPLPRAPDEAIAIGLQHRETALVGDQATPAAVQQRLTRARVAHFATHALANPEYPNLSWIALAPDEAHPRGLWFAGEIRQQPLQGTELVYLSACDGSAGQLSRAEGAASLARAFLDAGVGTVIASGWTVDDHIAGRISRAFYAEYTATGNATSALNAAQRALISEGDAVSPLAWSAMQVFTRNRAARPTS